MKILFVSDTVMSQMESAANLRRRYSDIDVLISCGDMPSVYLEFITSILSIPLLFVRGNHDEMYDNYPPGGQDLHHKIVTYKGISFAGLEGSMRYNKGRIQYTEAQMARQVIEMGPKMLYRRLRYGHGVDIFVTHSPAKGIHDAEDRPHNGFRSMLWFMQWYRPRYMVHGHVHTYDRRKTTETDYYDTHIVNINPITVMEIEPKSVKS